MNLMVINVDHLNTLKVNGKMSTVDRFVVKSDKIVGLVEHADGVVVIAVSSTEIGKPSIVAITNLFDEVAEFLMS